MPVAIHDGKKIRAAVKGLRITEAEFCRRHFIRPATLSVVISGQPCDPATLFTIARAIELEQKGAA